MTTIIYRDGLIAFDSRITQNGNIVSDSHNKSRWNGDNLFIFAGTTSDEDDFINAFTTGKQCDRALDISAFVFNRINRSVYECGCDGNIIWKCEVVTPNDYPLALGSGAAYSKALMMFTKMTLVDIIKSVAKLDCGTGGLIRQLNLQTLAITVVGLCNE